MTAAIRAQPAIAGPWWEWVTRRTGVTRLNVLRGPLMDSYSPTPRPPAGGLRHSGLVASYRSLHFRCEKLANMASPRPSSPSYSDVLKGTRSEQPDPATVGGEWQASTSSRKKKGKRFAVAQSSPSPTRALPKLTIRTDGMAPKTVARPDSGRARTALNPSHVRACPRASPKAARAPSSSAPNPSRIRVSPHSSPRVARSPPPPSPISPFKDLDLVWKSKRTCHHCMAC